MKRLFLLPLAFILFAVPMADEVLNESFEGGLPSDWQVWEEGTYYVGTYNHSWYTVNMSTYAHSGSWLLARYNGCYNPPFYTYDDSWVVTPTLDLSDYENISFSCWFFWFDGFVVDPDLYIMGSSTASPGPGDFTELLDMSPLPSDYEQRTVDASAYDGEPDVTFAIRFTYGGPDEWSNLPVFDDFLVSGDGTAVESATLGEIKAIYR